MKNIEVHYEEKNGVTGVVNYFTSLNAEASGDQSARASLLNRAVVSARKWGEIFPETKFFVKEVAR